MKVVAYAPDLMDGSKIGNAGAEMARRLEDLAVSGADIVLIDLARPGALDTVGSIPAHTIGFCRHPTLVLPA